ncbi:hypothetical protein F0562_025648 [Nyssa sinensis]|uniref:Uncharacterized protein n=1 Tax=Nyssa sinensis TaxID=561372 RepID=A0A5J5B9B0_9ASTE|nr:hypothetical protein F0562_025648 [Nyssa sinensis]
MLVRNTLAIELEERHADWSRMYRLRFGYAVMRYSVGACDFGVIGVVWRSYDCLRSEEDTGMGFVTLRLQILQGWRFK